MPRPSLDIPESLAECYRTATVLKIDLSDMNFILFSDHHRGTGDGADDFRFASATYAKALDHYFAQEATLVLLGDVEEFWENKPEAVMMRYREIVEQERQFDLAARYLRIYGNHDSDWSNHSFTRKFLETERPVLESVKIVLQDGPGTLGYIYLVHGHQGSFFSDTLARVSKLFVRYVWRHFQRIFNKPLDTAATSTRMRNRHDRFYYNWARHHKDPLVVITGHSHEPVFNGLTYADRLDLEHGELTRREDEGTLREGEQDRLKEVRRRIAALKKHNATHLNPEGYAIPCYYNTGCCSFADGEITGIELMDGEIRLIKWTVSGERRVMEKEGLRRVMSLRREEP